MTSVQSQSSYRVVVTRELRSRRTNRTLRDEVIWIGSLEPVPTEQLPMTRGRIGPTTPDSDSQQPYP